MRKRYGKKRAETRTDKQVAAMKKWANESFDAWRVKPRPLAQSSQLFLSMEFENIVFDEPRPRHAKLLTALTRPSDTLSPWERAGARDVFLKRFDHPSFQHLVGSGTFSLGTVLRPFRHPQKCSERMEIRSNILKRTTTILYLHHYLVTFYSQLHSSH